MHCIPPMGESPWVYLLGWLGDLVIMSECPPNYPVCIECTVTGALQSFHTSDDFTQSLLHGNTCLFRSSIRSILRPLAHRGLRFHPQVTRLMTSISVSI
jgi:hypothetical protein